MKSILSTLFSYLFMATIVVILVSSFALVIILIRHFLVSIGEDEKQLGYNFLIALVTSGILSPIFLFLNRKFDRIEKLKEEDV